MKVLTVVGTRPEIVRLSRVIALLDKAANQVLVHTGQNASPMLNSVFFSDLSIRQPDHFLNAPSATLGTFLGHVLPAMEALLHAEQPDAFVVLGDTNSALTAILAKRLSIRVYHLEAGNRCFDENVPEETNRRLIDHVADFNLVYTEHARRNLLQEGLHPRRVALVGSPMREVLDYYASQIAASTIVKDLALDDGSYFLVSAHRQENVDSPQRLGQLTLLLEQLAAKWKWPIIVSVHPRTRLRLDELGFSPPRLVRLLEPFGFLDYVNLQAHSACVLSDSGTISEESAILGFPSVTLRASMERPEALESGSIVMTGLSSERVDAGINWAMDGTLNREIPVEYEIANTSVRTVNFIMSTAPLHREWSGLLDG